MNILQIMQQAKAMQGKMAELQDRMGDVQVTGTAGGGAVTVLMTCKGRVLDVSIKPEILDPADPSMTEDLVKAAMNDARQKGDDTIATETKKMMEGMGLPAGMQLPF